MVSILLFILSLSALARDPFAEERAQSGVNRPCQESDFDLKDVDVVYQTLLGIRDCMTQGSVDAVGLYNKICMEWRTLVSAYSFTPEFIPLVSSDVAVPIPSLHIVPLQTRVALRLYHYRGQMQMLKAWQIMQLQGQKNKLVVYFEELQKEIIKSLCEGLGGQEFQECVQESKDRAWVCSDLLACASASIPTDIINMLPQVNQEWSLFFYKCLESYVSKVRIVVDALTPLSEYIMAIKKPVCMAVVHAVNTANDITRCVFRKNNPVWGGDQPRIKTLADFVSGLRELGKVYFSAGRSEAAFIGMFQNCNVEQIWQEIIEHGYVHVAQLAGTAREVAELIAWGEKAQVEDVLLLKYGITYARTARSLGHLNFATRVEKNTTFRKIFDGEGVENFCARIVIGEKQMPTSMCLIHYMEFLKWRGEVNWWAVLTALINAGCRYDGLQKSALRAVWENILESPVNFNCALQHLCDIANTRADQNVKNDVVHYVCQKLSERAKQGKTPIWARDSMIENVDMGSVDRMLTVIYNMCSRRCEHIFRFIVQCLPRGGVESHTSGLTLTPNDSESPYARWTNGADVLRTIGEIEYARSTSEKTPEYWDYMSYLTQLPKPIPWMTLLGGIRHVGWPESAVVSGGRYTTLALHQNNLSQCIWTEIRRQGAQDTKETLAYLCSLITQPGWQENYAQTEIKLVCEHLKQTNRLGVGYRFIKCGQELSMDAGARARCSSANMMLCSSIDQGSDWCSEWDPAYCVLWSINLDPQCKPKL